MRILCCLFCLLCLALPAAAKDRVFVMGVNDEDMLKLRAGPGTGYRILVGLPEGTALIRKSCDRVGGTPWCSVSLAAVPRLRGYVSGHYLSETPPSE